MRTCNDYRNDMDAWLDDELAAADRDRLQRHVAACTSCNRWFESQRRLQAGLTVLARAADRQADASPGRNLQRPSASTLRIAADRTPIRRTFGIWRSAAVVILVAGMGLLALWSWQNAPPIRHVRQPPIVAHNHRPSAAPQRNSSPDPQPLASIETRVRPLVETQLALAAPTRNPRIQVVWLYDAPANETASGVTP